MLTSKQLELLNKQPEYLYSWTITAAHHRFLDSDLYHRLRVIAYYKTRENQVKAAKKIKTMLLYNRTEQISKQLNGWFSCQSEDANLLRLFLETPLLFIDT